MEGFHFLAIPHEVIGGRHDAIMGHLNEFGRKFTLLQTILNKIPVKLIISFFEINFNKHTNFLTFHLRHGVNHVLCNNNVMVNIAPIIKLD